MGRHRRRMKREEIRELKAFPVDLGSMPVADTAWFKIEGQPLSGRRRDDDEHGADEDADETVEDEDLAPRLPLGDPSPVANEPTHLGEGRSPIAL